jgi:hypothetical protein
MMLDIDGDGLVDRINNASTQGINNPGSVTDCKVSWQPNVPGGGHFRTAQLLTFGDFGSTKMPMLRWQGSGTDTLAGSTQSDHDIDPVSVRTIRNHGQARIVVRRTALSNRMDVALNAFAPSEGTKIHEFCVEDSIELWA